MIYPKIISAIAGRRIANGILSAQVCLNGTNPFRTVSLTTLVGIGKYTIMLFVDKTIRKEGGEV